PFGSEADAGVEREEDHAREEENPLLVREHLASRLEVDRVDVGPVAEQEQTHPDEEELQEEEDEQHRDDEPAQDRLAELLDDDRIHGVVDALEQGPARRLGRDGEGAGAHWTSPLVTFMKISSRSARRWRNSITR